MSQALPPQGGWPAEATAWDTQSCLAGDVRGQTAAYQGGSAWVKRMKCGRTPLAPTAPPSGSLCALRWLARKGKLGRNWLWILSHWALLPTSPACTVLFSEQLPPWFSCLAPGLGAFAERPGRGEKAPSSIPRGICLPAGCGLCGIGRTLRPGMQLPLLVPTCWAPGSAVNVMSLYFVWDGDYYFNVWI